MRVEVDDARVVGPSNDFGEQYVTAKPAQAATYRGGTELLAENAIPSGRLEVVPVNGANPGVDVGDVFSGATVGPVDYSQFGGYLIAATTLGAVQHNHLARGTATAQGAKQLAVATYNVENLAARRPRRPSTSAWPRAWSPTSPSPTSWPSRRSRTTSAPTDDGTVAADQTLTKLTDAIVAAGGPRYQLARDRPGRRQGRRPARRQHPRRVPVRPARVSFVDRGRRRSTARPRARRWSRATATRR